MLAWPTMTNPDLLLESYDFELPPELIAQRPSQKRDHSRLLVYRESSDEIIHDHFYNIKKYLPFKAQLVFNQSKVFACRLTGQKTTGGKIEVFILSLERDQYGYPCMVKSSGKKKEGQEFHIGKFKGSVSRALDGKFWVQFHDDIEKIITEEGKIPIPPYIRGGESDDQDRKDYQTVYANETKQGSVAAPTAGLHFTPEILKELETDHQLSYVTLNVGLGTFAPVKVDNILEHDMHTEEYSIDAQNFEQIINDDAPRIAVGTTTLRCLESAMNEDGGWVYRPSDGVQSTDIFLYPGKEVHCAQGLLTNFHLPQSTLLMLVSSLIGREKTMQLYQEAIEHKYRFYSYGDCMLILRKDNNVDLYA